MRPRCWMTPHVAGNALEANCSINGQRATSHAACCQKLCFDQKRSRNKAVTRLSRSAVTSRGRERMCRSPESKMHSRAQPPKDLHVTGILAKGRHMPHRLHIHTQCCQHLREAEGNIVVEEVAHAGRRPVSYLTAA